LKEMRAIPVLLVLLVAARAETSFDRCPPSGPGNEACRWARAKLLGQPDSTPAVPHLMVYTRTGALARHRIADRAFRIASQEFPDGLAMMSPGEVLVRLPSPGARFQAIAGIDSNDLGYYSHAGRGSVIASVAVSGREPFRSPVLREGMPGIPVSVDLAGATEFSLKLAAVGERSKTYQAEWDQIDWANAQVTLADGATLRLADLPAGPLSPAYSADLPFSFRYGVRPSAELLKTWPVRRESRLLDAHRTEFVSTYTDPKTALTLRFVAVVYDDYPAVEWTVWFKNEGTAPTPILENLQGLDAQFDRNADGEFVLHHAKGSPNSATDYQPLSSTLAPRSEKRFVSKGGRPTDTDLCYFNLEWPGRGVILALGWPGQWAADFVRDEGASVRIRAGQEITRFRLNPGEELRTPLIALLFWQGDWIDGQNSWRRWMITHNLPRPSGQLPPPQLAGGSGRHTIEMQEANEENQLRYLRQDLDAGLPLDYWWMDAGWYPFRDGWWNTGTWDPDPQRFPRGFAPISAAAHDRRVRIIVWFEPERVTAGSWLAQNHPEWLLGTDGADKLLYLGNTEARQWLTEHVSQLIREQGIDLYRQDFNFEPLARWRFNEPENRQGWHEMQHVMGYLAFWDELRKRFPNLLIDTCASGGRRNDLETLRRAVPLWRSDHAYEPASMQLLTYGLAFWAPYFGTAFNSVDPYIFRSQMTPATAVGLEPGRIQDGYAKVRRLVDQWRQVAPNFYGDYYPLTPYRTESTEWIAWQFDRPEQHEGMVQAFRRPDSAFETARFRLRGLSPTSRYQVRDLDSATSTEYSGRDLHETGLPVTIPSKPGAVILTYKALPAR